MSDRFAGADQKFTIAKSAAVPVSGSGDASASTEFSWSLQDEDENEVASGSVATFPSTDTSVDITILASEMGVDVNTFTGSVGRLLVGTFSDGTDTYRTEDYFLLLSRTQLVRQENSFQTYTEALRRRQEVGISLSGWDSGTKNGRISALQEAYSRICQMGFHVPGYNASSVNQKSAAYGRGTDDPWFQSGRVKLATLTAGEFDELPEAFKKAIKKAQVVEANIAMGGDKIAELRKQGLISKTTGESSAFFKSTPYLNLPVSRETHEILKRYIVFQTRIDRA